MALWLKGAIEEIDCEGEGCPFCPYQIYEDEETFACEGIDRWRGYHMAIELWWLLGKQRRGERLRDLSGEMERDEDDVRFMNLNQLQDAISLMAGLRSELFEFTGNKDFNFNPDKIDWDLSTTRKSESNFSLGSRLIKFEARIKTDFSFLCRYIHKVKWSLQLRYGHLAVDNLCSLLLKRMVSQNYELSKFSLLIPDYSSF